MVAALRLLSARLHVCFSSPLPRMHPAAKRRRGVLVPQQDNASNIFVICGIVGFKSALAVACVSGLGKSPGVESPMRRAAGAVQLGQLPRAVMLLSEARASSSRLKESLCGSHLLRMPRPSKPPQIMRPEILLAKHVVQQNHIDAEHLAALACELVRIIMDRLSNFSEELGDQELTGVLKQRKMH